MSEQAALRLTDFGLAAWAPGPAEPPLSEIVGSAPYVAPEVLRRSYGPPADLWPEWVNPQEH